MPSQTRDPLSIPARMKTFAVSAGAWRLAGSSAVSAMEQRFGQDLSTLRIPEVEAEVAALTTEDQDRLWSELVEVGWAHGRALRPEFAAAIVQAAAPDIAIRVVSTFGKVNFLADLTFAGDRGMSVVRRRLLAEDALGELVVAAEDHAIEVTLFATPDAWTAVRRCLPPDEALRADPSEAQPARERVHPFTAQDRAAFVAALDNSSAGERLGTILERSEALDPAVRDALADPVATVALAVMTGPRIEPGVLGGRLYALGRSGLFALGLREDDLAVTEVTPGTIALDVVWMFAGAVEHAGAAMREGRS